MGRRALIAALAGLAVSAPPAAAQSVPKGPCLLGTTTPRCYVWHGRVTYVDDGDTIAVDIDGDGIDHGRRIRVTGIQAMEQTTYPMKASQRRGECHAVEASALVDQLVKLSHGQVRLAAIDPASSSRGRPRRSVAFRIHGSWWDMGRYLLARGEALWFPNRVEYAWNAGYAELSQEAAAAHVGLYDTTYCGLGPDDDVPLRLWVNWDAEGDDTVNPDGEWIQIRNDSPVTDLPLAGWWVRDSDLRRFTFPPGAHIPPLSSVRVYVGPGPQSDTEFHWGLEVPAFENVNAKLGLGDGAYLFDPQGDLRAWMIYPCRYACTNPLQGALVLAAHPRGSEYVTIQNVSGFPIDLEGYELTTPGASYPFPADSTIDPGETMRVDVFGSADGDTRLEKHMDEGDPILPDKKGAVQVRTFTDIVAACDSWGSATC